MAKHNRTLHVGLIGPLPPPFGGMANQLNQLKELLDKESIQVSLVQTNQPYGNKIIEKTKGLRAVCRLIPYFFKVWALAGKVDVIHMLANSGWSWQLFAAPVLWIGWLRGTPVIINYRGGEAREYFNQSIQWVRPSIDKAAAVVVPSGYLNAVFSDFGIDSQIIPNIINLDRFRVSQNKNKFNRQQPHLIVTRNLEPVYGITTAIKALSIVQKELPDIRLSIAGSGPQNEYLQQLVEQQNLKKNVNFTGKLNPDEMADLYRSADVMINPTTVDNMPNSVIEALASSVPVVTTNVGGIPYIVADAKTALFCEVNNPEAMATQILRLLNDTTLYNALVVNGLNEVQKYTWEKVSVSWLGLYESLARLK